MASLYPQLNQDPFKAGVMDRPDLQTRKAALMVKLGQALGPQDLTRLAQRQGLEEQNALSVTADFNNRQPGQPGYSGRVGQPDNPMLSGAWSMGQPSRGYVPGGNPAFADTMARARASRASYDAGGTLGELPNTAYADPMMAGLPSGVPNDIATSPMGPQSNDIFSAGMPSGFSPSPNSIYNNLSGTGADPFNPFMQKAQGLQNLARGAQDIQGQKAQLGLVQTQQKIQQQSADNSAFAAAHAPGVSDPVQAYINAGGSSSQHLAQLKKDAMDKVKLEMQKDTIAKKDAATAQKAADAKKADAEKTRQIVENTGNVLATIDRVAPLISGKTAGWGSIMKNVPESDAKLVEADLKTITASLGMDTLMAMRNAAKTGSSGLGQLTEREFDNLVASKKNLDQAQTPERLRENLAQVKKSYNALNMLARGINPDTGHPADAIPVPQGVDGAVWNVMTPEEKALWRK